MREASPHLRRFEASGSIEVFGELPSGPSTALSMSMLRLDVERRIGRTTFAAIEPRTRTIVASLIEALGVPDVTIPDEARAIALARALADRVGVRAQGPDDARVRLSHAGHGAAAWAAVRAMEAGWRAERLDALVAETEEADEAVRDLVM